jgi:hypothetical protein
MWYKTRTGLVYTEGTVEIGADRWAQKGGRRVAGVFIYQAHHPETIVKPLLQSSARLTGRKIYLAMFSDDGTGERTVTETMRRIESAIRLDQAVCDLSDLGDDAAWPAPDYGMFAGWQTG